MEQMAAFDPLRSLGRRGKSQGLGDDTLAYQDTTGDNARLLIRAIKGTTDFSGRSRRTEVIYLWIAVTLACVIIGFPLEMALPVEAGRVVTEALRLFLSIPMFALFARRLHDQGRSGWWALLLPIAMAPSIARWIEWVTGNPQAVDPSATGPFLWIGAAIGVAILILLFLPGTDGSNQFGPDPRLTE